MVGTNKRTEKKSSANVTRQNRNNVSTGSTKVHGNSFISSTPALGSSGSQFQFLTSPIPSDTEESINWISADTMIFKTPKAPSPARTRRRTTMINFHQPLLNELKDSSTTSDFKVPNVAINSPPGVKTRSRRSSIYTSIKHKETEIKGKGGDNVHIEQSETEHVIKKKSINKNKARNAQKIEDAQKVVATKIARSQRSVVKRKAAESEAPPLIKHVKKDQIKSSQVKKKEPQAAEHFQAEKNIAETGGLFDTDGQLDSSNPMQSTTVPEPVANMEFPGKERSSSNGTSVLALYQAKRATNGDLYFDHESPMKFSGDDKENLARKDSQGLFNNASFLDKPAKGNPILSPKNSKIAAIEEHSITNQDRMVESEEVLSKHASFTKSHGSQVDVSFVDNFNSSFQSRTSSSRHEVEVINVEESLHQLESTSIENGMNGFTDLPKSPARKSNKSIEKNLPDVDASIENPNQIESFEDEENLADITVGYSTLSQRCTIL
ncbi:hypothetical protein ElyMa_000217900 [Elysia marginata]|uniref:Uncharacterized protein n=1 Tax=Elysia marginata TaxID=1093978 RepID=A0AAV4EZA9_9GAST|nr:hypothetical protein ElyMa_000217900 [Elysia marginata]